MVWGWAAVTVIDSAHGAPGPPAAAHSGCERSLRRLLAGRRTQRRLAARRLDQHSVRRDEQRRLRHLLRRHPVFVHPVDHCVVTIQSFPPERIAALDGQPIDSAWIGELAGLAELSPESVPAAAMLTMIGQLHRLVGWAQATGLQWMAGFARPGVAIPVGNVLGLAANAASDMRVHEAHPVQPVDEDFTARGYPETSVYGDPVWDGVVAAHAARLAAAEIGAMLHMSPITARARTEQALTMVDDLPATLAGWRSGRIDRGRAMVIAEATAVVDPDSRHMIDESIMDARAEGARDPERLTPGRLRRLVDKLVIQADPAAAQHRAELAFADRKTQVTPIGGDMARFSADLKAPIALLTDEVLDTIAKNLSTESRDGRTLNHTRADIFAGIFTTLASHGHVDVRQSERGFGDCPGNGSAELIDDCVAINPWKPLGHSVSVTIAASTLAGLDQCPGHLDRYGWITADLARAITESARSVRTIVWRDGHSDSDHRPADHRPHAHQPYDPPRSDQRDAGGSTGRSDTAPPPEAHCHDGCAGPVDTSGNGRWCGTDLDYGRSVYRPPAVLQELVNHRDRTCRFPGCNTPAHRCDHDHRVPYNHSGTITGSGTESGGVTCPCNLDALCRFHHRVKTFTAWTAVRLPGNQLQWTSPHGLSCTDQPESLPLGRAFAAGDVKGGGP